MPELTNPTPAEQEKPREIVPEKVPMVMGKDPVPPKPTLWNQVMDSYPVNYGKFTAWGAIDPIPGYSRPESFILGLVNEPIARRISWNEETGAGAAAEMRMRLNAPDEVSVPTIISPDWPGSRVFMPMYLPLSGSYSDQSARREILMGMADASILNPWDPVDLAGRLVGGTIMAGMNLARVGRETRMLNHPSNVSTWARTYTENTFFSRLYAAARRDVVNGGPLNNDWTYLMTDNWMADMLDNHALGFYERYKGKLTKMRAMGDDPTTRSARLFEARLDKMAKDPQRKSYERYIQYLHDYGSNEELKLKIRKLQIKYFGALAMYDELQTPFVFSPLYGRAAPVVSATPDNMVVRVRGGDLQWVRDARINDIMTWDQLTDKGAKKDIVSFLQLNPNNSRRVHSADAMIARYGQEWYNTYQHRRILPPSRRERVDIASSKAWGELEENKWQAPLSRVLNQIRASEYGNLPIVPKPAHYARYNGTITQNMDNAQIYDLMESFVDRGIIEGWISDPARTRQFIEEVPEYRDLFFNPRDNDGSMQLGYLIRVDQDYLSELEALVRSEKGLPDESYSVDRVSYAKMPHGFDFGIKYSIQNDPSQAAMDWISFPNGTLTDPEVQTRLAQLNWYIDERKLALDVEAGKAAPEIYDSNNKLVRVTQHRNESYSWGMDKVKRAHDWMSYYMTRRFDTPNGSRKVYDPGKNIFYDAEDVWKQAEYNMRNDIEVKLNQPLSEWKHGEGDWHTKKMPLSEWVTRIEALKRSYLYDSGVIHAGQRPSETQIARYSKRIKQGITTNAYLSNTHLPDEKSFSAYVRADPLLVDIKPMSWYIDDVLDQAMRKELPIEINLPDSKIGTTISGLMETTMYGADVPTRAIMDEGGIINYRNLITMADDYRKGAPLMHGFQGHGMDPHHAESVQEMMTQNNRALLRNSGFRLMVSGEETELTKLVADGRCAPIYYTDYGLRVALDETAARQYLISVAEPYVVKLSNDETTKILNELNQFVDGNFQHTQVTFARGSELAAQALAEDIPPDQIQSIIRAANRDESIVNLKDPLPPLGYDNIFETDPILNHAGNKPALDKLRRARMLEDPGHEAWTLRLDLPTRKTQWTADDIYDTYQTQVRSLVLSRPRAAMTRLADISVIRHLVPTPEGINTTIELLKRTADYMPYYNSVVGHDPIANGVLAKLIDDFTETRRLLEQNKWNPIELESTFDQLAETADQLGVRMRSRFGAFWKIHASGAGFSRERLFLMLNTREDEALLKLDNFLTQADEFRFTARRVKPNLTPDESASLMQDLLTHTSSARLGDNSEAILPSNWFHELSALGHSSIGEAGEITRYEYQQAQHSLYALGRQMDEITKARKITPEAVELFNRSYEEVIKIVPAIRERIHISKLAQMSARIGRDTELGARLFTKQMMGIEILAGIPVLAGIAKVHFTMESTDEDVEQGVGKIKMLYGAGSINKDEMERAIHYAHSYRIMDEPDPFKEIIRAHHAIEEEQMDEILIIRQLRGTEDRNEELDRIFKSMADNPFYAELYVANTIHNYGEDNLSAWLDAIERDTGLSKKTSWQAITAYPGIPFSTKVTLIGRLMREWFNTHIRDD